MEFKDIILNKCQTPIEDLHLENEPEEVLELFWDFFYNVPFILRLTSQTRLYAKDLPRDDSGKIIIDVTLPHILEDMDYFRPAALHYLKYGCYTRLRPNPNPNSEFGKWISEEVRRCREGYVRPSDGEWVTGDFYYFLNYAPMLVIKKKDLTDKKGFRVLSFPSVWEGHYYKFHAIKQARDSGHHYAELASRSKGKSYCAASMLANRFELGESKDVNKKVTCYITADEKKYLVAGDLTLDKFQFNIDWMANNMELPSMRLISSLSNMLWIMGYKDSENGTNRGTLNSVIGVTSKDDPAKLRGSRGVLYVIEEFGTFPALGNLYSNLRPSVEDGDDVFGLIIMYGTAGDSESDFSSALELVYNPEGYNIMAFENIYDKEGTGKRKFAYFFPGYLNLASCYDENGNSDVTKALLSILKKRHQIKYNTTDIKAITKAVAEIPITPLEAMLRTRGNIFPVTALNERLNEIDNNPNIYDDIYVGTLVQKSNGDVEFTPTSDLPIRNYPLKDNTETGSFEFYQLPERDNTGKVKPYRYIAGLDPYNNDLAESQSLGSFFVLDLLTDRIVCEYTGRTTYLDEFFEKVRLACIFYNAKCLYESNIRGAFAYFSKMNCVHLLADTPEYLRDKQIIKYSSFGSSSKGVAASKTVNLFADNLTRDWLLKPVVVNYIEDDIPKEKTVPNLMFLKNRALIKELISYNPYGNFDRIRALGMLMLYREEKMILYSGDVSSVNDDPPPEDPDDFFNLNYDERFSNNLEIFDTNNDN